MSIASMELGCSAEYLGGANSFMKLFLNPNSPSETSNTNLRLHYKRARNRNQHTSAIDEQKAAPRYKLDDGIR